ncbi:MAG: ankyrin repeat domain-containing protein [Gemmataceae bacterium]|nr:ankyrin repeat domain-containing protein [Gemmataceae bacterium]
MVYGCLTSLLLCGGLIALVHPVVVRSVDTPVAWGVSAGLAFANLLAVGALWNAARAWGNARLIGRAVAGESPVEGRRAAVAGRVEAIGATMQAPFSGKPCVLYEIDISHDSEVPQSDDDSTRTVSVKDFGGVGKVPFAVRNDFEAVRIFGMPDLDALPARTFARRADLARITRFVRETEWQDYSGLNVLKGAKRLWSTLSTQEESFVQHWRLIALADCAWLESEDSGAEFTLPTFTEKIVAPGDVVTIVGYCDGQLGGLTSTVTRDGNILTIYTGEPRAALARQRRSFFSNLIGGILGLALINGIATVGMQLYRNAPERQKELATRLSKAVADGDPAGVESAFVRGLKPGSRKDSSERSALWDATDATMVALLVERGIDPNATDKEGNTALMAAASSGRAEVVKALLAGGADINARNPKSLRTALVAAIGAERHECVAVLRAAGAIDDTVNAGNGRPITPNDEPYRICREYNAAVHGRNLPRILELSAPERASYLHDIDWDAWQSSRPIEPVTITGYWRDDHATVAIEGDTPRSGRQTWVIQLFRSGGQWRIVRERWVLSGRVD